MLTTNSVPVSESMRESDGVAALDVPIGSAPTENNRRDVVLGSSDEKLNEKPSEKTNAKRDASGRSTSHLKEVPPSLEEREFLKHAAEKYAEKVDRSRPFTRSQLEKMGRELLTQLGKPEKYLGFTMVMIGNFFWKRQFLALPFHRRMLLLPHCLKHADGCPADYDEFGLDCERCGACSIADYKVKAEQLGYKVLVAEGSPVVLKIIVSGHIDGILGVACLNVLEKAIDKVLIAGVPAYAVPLHSGDCKNTKLDEAWVWDCLDRYEPLDSLETSGYVPLMRAANRIFDDQLDEILPATPEKKTDSSKAAKNPATSNDPADEEHPLRFTQTLSRRALIRGGKRLRPFITLAAYEALTRTEERPASMETVPVMPLSVRRVAAAMEAFHKASLVHDDIEDDDNYRYGQKTLHCQYDLGTAINVGDHLIGLGYRLVTQTRHELDPSAVADIADQLAAAHLKLCDGQGAELRWTSTGSLNVSPLEAMKIYALKTSPAFEVALYSGIRLAGSATEYEAMIPQFSRHLGVGFQILNDLKDWEEGESNKVVAGKDAAMAKPTLLLTLALEAANAEQRQELERLIHPESTVPAEERISRLRAAYDDLGVFQKAEALVEKCRARAEALADETTPEPLRHLLYFLVDTVLAKELEATPQVGGTHHSHAPQGMVQLTIPAMHSRAGSAAVVATTH